MLLAWDKPRNGVAMVGEKGSLLYERACGKGSTGGYGSQMAVREQGVPNIWQPKQCMVGATDAEGAGTWLRVGLLIVNRTVPLQLSCLLLNVKRSLA